VLRPAPLPVRVDPMLAVLTEERFSDPAWIFERKLDGIRCVAIAGEGAVRLRSRNHLSLSGRFPEVVAALEAAVSRAVLDGEVVAFDGARTSFARRSSALRARRGRAVTSWPARCRRSKT